MHLLEKIQHVNSFTFFDSEVVLHTSKEIDRPTLIKKALGSRPFLTFKDYILYQHAAQTNILVYDKEFKLICEFPSGFSLYVSKSFEPHILYIAVIIPGSWTTDQFIKVDEDLNLGQVIKVKRIRSWNKVDNDFYYLNRKEKDLFKSKSLGDNECIWRTSLLTYFREDERINYYSDEHQDYIFIASRRQNLICVSKVSGKVVFAKIYPKISYCSFCVYHSGIIVQEGTKMHKLNFMGDIIMSKELKIPNVKFCADEGILQYESKIILRDVREKIICVIDIDSLEYLSHYEMENRPINSVLSWKIVDGKLYQRDQKATLYILKL